MAAKYTLHELTARLGSSGWQLVTGNSAMPVNGTLGEMAETAHTRHSKGQASGYLQEIETEIEVDMLQLQELWHHLGLPV